MEDDFVVLQNRTAIVTGAASGIGRAIALLFAEEGANVVIADIDSKGAEDAALNIKKSGGAAIAVTADVTKEEDIGRIVDSAFKEYGSLDILVNNAGILDNIKPAHEMTDEIWERVFAVNVTGPMRAIRKTLPLFLEKGKGIIINIASVGGFFGARGGAAYTASKHALVGLTKSVGYHYAKNGVRCNAIAPGNVNTNIKYTLTDPSALGFEKLMEGLGQSPRYGEPEEIARVALYLAADDSRIINGTVITADAGWTAY
jgi:NAD(P)-dependent dehydrogenase (short-subunit alcohol dehydrogenase family)